MQRKEHKIVIIWSGEIDPLNILAGRNIEIFENIGVDDVKPVISKLDFSSISAVIGAPGIAAEIRQLIPVPLIIAYPTYIDILETVKYAEINHKLEHRKIALILHEGNRIEEDRLGYFIHNIVELYTYRSKAHMRQIFERISDKEYALVIGGPTAVSMAKSFNIDAVQLIYREQALLDALEKTKEILFLMDKELHQMERLKAIINIIPDGIIETDGEENIGMCNKKALELLGLSYDQVLGNNVCRILKDPSWENVYRHNVAQVDALITYRKNKYFSTRHPILEDGATIGSVGTLQEAEKIQGMESKFRSLQSKGLTAKYTFSDIICESTIMKEIIERARIYTQCDSTILLEGETGTGKEVFAQSIHNESPRRHGPFVAVNCAALTETLLESELMGYDEGAFTGARKGGKIGLFEQAHMGTIFLDEINQIPLQLQAKLLRVIQEKAVRHLGGNSVIPVDVRIIAATNESLKDKIAVRGFRNDLYYRINVLNIYLPPLRERREDIPRLMRHFVDPSGADQSTTEQHVIFMRNLVENYSWPGNIRELQNFVERYMILGQRIHEFDKYFFREFQEKQISALPEINDETLLRIPMGSLESMGNALIRAVVERCGGNKSKAALVMNISRNTIHQRMKEA